MNIKHDPIFNIKKLEEIYSKKDGVLVKYVCTSELVNRDVPMDIFYRETPHPEFGNKYFAIFLKPGTDTIMITDADKIEDLEFGMIDVDGEWIYSRYNHENIMRTDSAGNHKHIDGGRQYARGWGYEFFEVKDGEFISKETT